MTSTEDAPPLHQQPQDPDRKPQSTLLPEPAPLKTYTTTEIAAGVRRRDEALRASLHQAAEHDPDRFAEARALGLETDIDARVTERNIDMIRKLARQRQVIRKRLTQSSPSLARQLTDPTFAALAHDDIDELSALESITQASEQGYQEAQLMILYHERANAGKIAPPQLLEQIEEIEALLRDMPLEPDGFLSLFTGTARVVGGMVPAFENALQDATGGMVVGGSLGSLAPGVGTAVGAAAGAAVTGASSLFNTFYAMSRGESYRGLRELGLEHQVARHTSMVVGGINAALEFAGTAIVAAPARKGVRALLNRKINENLRRVTTGASVSTLVAGTVIGATGESATEAAQEIGNIIGEEVALFVDGDENAFENAAKREAWTTRVAHVAAEAFRSTLLLSGSSSGIRFASDMKRVRQADQDAEFVQQLADGTLNSKTAERAPDMFRDFLQNAADGKPVDTLYVDPHALDDALAQNKIDRPAFRKIMPKVEEQIDEAKQTGGLVAIEIGDYYAHIAPITPLHDSLKQSLKVSPDHPSLEEAHELQVSAEELATEAETVLKKHAKKADEFEAEASVIEKDKLAEILATGRRNLPPKQARAAAKIHRNMMVALADRWGQTPAQVQTRFPFAFVATEEEALARPVVERDAQTDDESLAQAPQTEEFRKFFGESKVVDDSGAPLTVFHGTNQPLDAFDPETLGTMTQAVSAKEGFFFTSSAEEAGNYADVAARRLVPDQKAFDEKSADLQRRVEAAERKRDFDTSERLTIEREDLEIGAMRDTTSGTRIVPVFLSMQNPMIKDFGGATASTGEIAGFVQSAKESGHDGAILKNIRDNVVFDNPTTHYAVFESGQIKSVNNRGTFDASDANILKQSPNVTAVFYSALSKSIGEVSTKSTNAAGWKQTIAGLVKKGKVKADEIEWTGLLDWLELQDGKISKAQVLEYLDENGVQVDTSRLSGEEGDEFFDHELREIGRQPTGEVGVVDVEFEDLNSGDTFTVNLDEEGGNVVVQTASGQFIPVDGMTNNQSIRDAIEAIENHLVNLYTEDLESPGEDGAAKFEQYTLPGGENYREILVTLPRKMESDAEFAKRREEFVEREHRDFKVVQEGEDGFLAIDNRTGRALRHYDTEAKAWAAIEAVVEGRADGLNRAFASGAAFESPHFDEANIVAHLRVDDRFDADGRKILFVEEVQSDWAQAGRAAGFALPPERAVELQKIVDEAEMLGEDATPAQRQAWVDAMNELQTPSVRDQRAPRAPFVESTKGWLNLALKQVLLDAVNGGYSAIAIVDGQTSADRYDLSNVVDHIDVGSLEGGEFAMTVELIDSGNTLNMTVDDNGVVTHSSVGAYNGKPLADVIGKEPAENVMQEAASMADFTAGFEVHPAPEEAGVDPQAPPITFSISDANGEWVRSIGGNIRTFHGRASAESEITNRTFAARNAGDIGVVKGEGLKIGGEGMIEFYDRMVPQALAKLSKKFGGPKLHTTEVTSRGEQLIPANFPALDIDAQLTESVRGGLPLFQGDRGEFFPGRLTAVLHEDADFSTVVHEMSHAFFEMHERIIEGPDAPQGIVDDFDTFLGWTGVESFGAWRSLSFEQRRQHSEAFASAFEIYLFEGKAPSSAMRKLFDKVRLFMTAVYKDVLAVINADYRAEHGRDLPALSQEMRSVFDRMLASEQQVTRADAIRGFAPMFETQEQSGLSDDMWAGYQEMIVEAREAAVTDVALASLKQMQWLDGARSKVLKKIQAKHNKKRRKIRGEVVADVAERRVYETIHYLRNGVIHLPEGGRADVEGVHKLDTRRVRELLGLGRRNAPTQVGDMELLAAIASLGGLSSEVALAIGIDPAEIGTRGVGIKRAFTKGGKTLDAMREALAQEGFQLEDEAALSDAITESVGGAEVFAETKEFSEFELDDEFEAFRATQAPEPGAPEAVVDLRVALSGMTTQGGVEPSMVADRFGYATVSEMLDELANAQPEKAVVADETDARMVAEHGDLNDPKQRDVLVQEALHNDARARFVAVELRFLQKIKQPVASMTAAAKIAARKILGGKTWKEIRPSVYAAAEMRARRAAERASAKGDPRGAIESKVQELLQHHLAKEALVARRELEKFEKGARKFARTDKKLGKTRNVDYVAVAREILGQIGLGKKTPGEGVRHLDNIAEHAPELLEDLQPLLRAATGFDTNWKNIRYEDLQLIEIALDALWFQSKRDRVIDVEGEKIERQVIKDALLDVLPKPDPAKQLPRTPTAFERFKRKVADVVTGFKQVEAWTIARDGGKLGGVVHRYLFSLLREPVNAYESEKESLVRAIQERINGHDLGRRKKEIVAHELRGFVFKNKAELLGALRQAGNASNLRALLLGESPMQRSMIAHPEKRNDEIDTASWWQFVDRMIEDGVLTKADFELVQFLWDTYDTLLPRSQEAHFELYGYRFEVIQKVPIRNRFGSFRGGYVPLKYDPMQTEKRIESDNPMHESSAAYQESFPSTSKGFTISRVNFNKPLLLDITMDTRTLDEHLRFIHLQRAGRDVLRLLRDDDIAGALNEVSPGIIKEMFEPWLDSTLNNRVMTPGKSQLANETLTTLRRRTGLATMMGNVSVGLQQLSGIGNSLMFVSLGHLRGAAAAYAANISGTTAEVMKLSQFMENRLRKGTGQIRDDANPMLQPGMWSSAEKWSLEHGYFMQRWMQQPVDVITWRGRYNQSLAENPGDEKGAVRDADAAVRRSQSSGQAADLSRIEKGAPIMRLMMQYSTFWIATANAIASRQGPGAKIGAGAIAVMFASIVAGVITQSLRGGWEDDDGDGALWDDVTTWALSEVGGGIAALAVPTFGPMAVRVTTGQFGGRLSFGAGFGALERALTAPRNALSKFDGRDVKDIGMLISIVTGVPITPVTDRVRFLIDAEDTTGRVRGGIVGR